MRDNPTPAEAVMWTLLECYGFQNQSPIGNFIPDFIHRGLLVVVEVDGHGSRNDAAKTIFLEERDFRIFRFWNEEVLDPTFTDTAKWHDLIDFLTGEIQ